VNIITKCKFKSYWNDKNFIIFTK